MEKTHDKDETEYKNTAKKKFELLKPVRYDI